MAPVPYGPGEYLEYEVRLGPFRVGEGRMEVVGIDTLRGVPTYHVRFELHGGVPFARVDDVFESWIDLSTLSSRRFRQDQREVRYRRRREFEFFPDEARFRRPDTGEEGSLPTLLPLDEVAFVYFVRTLDLEPGRRYRFDRYFKADGNPVILEVLRRETVTVPAGTFATVVVRPIIQTRGLFSRGGRAEVYFSDDDRRIVVKLESRIPILGSLTLLLRRMEEGVRVAPGPRSGR